mgnify:CR=1 FL=1
MNSSDEKNHQKQIFKSMTQNLGLVLPREREEALFESYLGLREMAQQLRRPRTAAAEPAGIFDVGTIGREG